MRWVFSIDRIIHTRSPTRASSEYISTCQQWGVGLGGGWRGKTPAFLCVPPFYLPTIDVRRDWQLYRLSPVFWLQFVSACHPIRQLSPGGGTNPTGHYEAGLIPTTAAAEAFQGGFWSTIPCLSHSSVGLGRRLQCIVVVPLHHLCLVLSRGLGDSCSGYLFFFFFFTFTPTWISIICCV